MNDMSGRSRKTTHFSLQHDGTTLSHQELVDSLNDFYVSVNADIPSLDITTFPTFLRSNEVGQTIQPYEVCKKLLSIKPSETHGPDNIPCRVLNKFAYELAATITTIFNVSLTNGIVPGMWKDSNITPIPKIKLATSEDDIRPISLTPCLSKTLEDFAMSGIVDHVRENIDLNQFGCLKGTSTTYCMLDMGHTWLSHVDPPGKHLGVCFLDFSKSFERIGYNVLITKLMDIGVR